MASTPLGLSLIKSECLVIKAGDDDVTTSLIIEQVLLKIILSISPPLQNIKNINAMKFFVVFWLFHVMCKVFSLPQFNPGDAAPSFSIQTLDGRLVYKTKMPNDTTPSNPIIFSAFTDHSAFLRALWTEEGSVRHLLERSPKNTQYIFLSLADNAKDDVEYMRGKIFKEMEKLYIERKKKLVILILYF